MSAMKVRRPTEEAAVAAASRRARPTPSLPAVLADMTTAHRMQDREGILLLACRAVRATSLEVGE
ncbi:MULTISPECIES: hypothetical protein [Streptomyces]|uniref:Uncharacterized protein n=2 Tax=Streptomyces TaxID=1883 RepID=A0A2U9P106_STRAS|nr:hypothetical protein [Streptomyces actuosus]AWT42825.1 hypothetical protein DMT42_11150 [Streptomyces actuosus]MBM4820056.1 hypothetical protein [Streptomyces actuosus]MBM4825062.1 hypothetical protein [Streptomyces actuosus]